MKDHSDLYYVIMTTLGLAAIALILWGMGGLCLLAWESDGVARKGAAILLGLFILAVLNGLDD
jgi:hypothetical protein